MSNVELKLIGMDKTLPTAFIAGQLLSRTKFADFLFLQRQKKAIENS